MHVGKVSSYANLTLIHSKGQSQGHAHFKVMEGEVWERPEESGSKGKGSVGRVVIGRTGTGGKGK